MFITSKNAIIEALSKSMVEYLYVKYPLESREKEIVKIAGRQGIRVLPVDKDTMLANTGKVGKVVAKVKEEKTFGIEGIVSEALKKSNTPLIYILDGITDVHNLGAIIRNAYFFGSAGIILPKDNSAQIDDKVTEVSSGAAYHIPIAVETNLSRSLDYLRENNFWIYYASEKGDTELATFKFDTPTVIILGNEHSGVRDLLKKKSDGSIKISSMTGFDSLNVSSSCAIFSYAYSISVNK